MKIRHLLPSLAALLVLHHAPVQASGAAFAATGAFTPCVLLGTDFFQRANSSLTTPWSPLTGAPANLEIVSDVVVTSDLTADTAYRNAPFTWPNDQCSSVIVGAPTTIAQNAGYGPAVRLDTGASNTSGYFSVASAAGWVVDKIVTGTITRLGGNTTPVFANNDAAVLAVQGTQLAFYQFHNGTYAPVWTGTDSSLSTGAPGIAYSSTDSGASYILAWSGGRATALPTGGGGSPSAIKFHTGPYMETGTSPFAYAGTGVPGFVTGTEIPDLRAGPSQVQGFEWIAYWSDFEPTTLGSYTFADLDTVYTQVTGYVSGSMGGAVYSNPRRLMIWVATENYFTSPGATSILPTYITGNPGTYGTSPVGGQGGWWTHNTGPGGPITALWRPAVMNRLIALGQAICSHVLPDGYTVDTSPYIEAISSMQSETAAYPAAGSDINDTTYIGLYSTLASAMVAACPHTITANVNNYLDTLANTNSILVNTIAVGMSGADTDTFGYSSNPPATCTQAQCGLTWGQQAWIGQGIGSDRRGTLPYLGAVQSTELGDESSYTPADLFQQDDTTLNATHVRWMYVNWQTGPNAGNNYYGTCANLSAWTATPAACGGELYTMVNSPLTHTSCPTVFTSHGGCNTH